MGDAIVRFDNVSKRFRLGQSHDSLRDLIAATVRRLAGHKPRRRGGDTLWALRDVDFAVHRGEALGIIGPNGAGKSTALKLLAGIMRPTEGTVSVRGRLAALIEVGAGFHGDLTGRENVFLNGSILGMRRAEISRKLDDIVSFAGIERFIDTPVKRYSSGMYARLGFSIAAHVDPDILLVDEVLSVGDAVFRLRCLQRMGELVQGGTTLLFVTHNLDQMQSICKTAVVLDEGHKVFQGSAYDAVRHYLSAMSRAVVSRPTDVTPAAEDGAAHVRVVSLRFFDSAGTEIVWTRPNEAVRAELILDLRRPVREAVVELNMHSAASEALISLNSGRNGDRFDCEAGRHCFTVSLPSIPVAGGHYHWNARLWDGATGETLLDAPTQVPLIIDDQGRGNGLLCIPNDWSLRTVDDDDTRATGSSPKAGACQSGASQIVPGGLDRAGLSVR